MNRCVRCTTIMPQNGVEQNDFRSFCDECLTDFERDDDFEEIGHERVAASHESADNNGSEKARFGESIDVPNSETLRR